jgi:hypothetical protein
MRNLIDIITETETLCESLTADKLEAFIVHQLDTDSTYVAHLRNTPGDDALKAVQAACDAAIVHPKVIALGHNMVGKELPDLFGKGGFIVLGITGNLGMCLGAAGLRNLQNQILDAAHLGVPISILIIEPGRYESALGPQVASRFHEIEYQQTAPNKLADGGIHRIT